MKLLKILKWLFVGECVTALDKWADVHSIVRVEGRNCANCDHGVMVSIHYVDCTRDDEDADTCLSDYPCMWEGPENIPEFEETDESLRDRILERKKP